MKTTKKNINSLEKLGKKTINLGFSPVPYDYLIRINNREVGAVLDNRCYLILTPLLKEILPNAEIFQPLSQGYYEYVDFTQTENSDLFNRCLKAVYQDLHYRNDLVTDFLSIYESYQNYPDDIARFYEKDTLFLAFCYEKGLLKRNPIDSKGRMIQSQFLRKDLTELGDKIFPLLLRKFLQYGDRTQNPDYQKMLPKWFAELSKK